MENEELQEAWSFATTLEQVSAADYMYDFNKGYKELQQYKVNLKAEPTPSEIIEALATVQGYKDRVTSMCIIANNVLGIAKRSYETCYDSELPNRQEKNAEARVSSVKNIYRTQYNFYKKAEEFYEACTLVLQNIKSTYETLSRQITVIQLQVDIKEYRDFTSVPSHQVEDKKSKYVNWGKR